MTNKPARLKYLIGAPIAAILIASGIYVESLHGRTALAGALVVSGFVIAKLLMPPPGSLLPDKRWVDILFAAFLTVCGLLVLCKTYVALQTGDIHVTSRFGDGLNVNLNDNAKQFYFHLIILVFSGVVCIFGSVFFIFKCSFVRHRKRD